MKTLATLAAAALLGLGAALAVPQDAPQDTAPDAREPAPAGTSDGARGALEESFRGAGIELDLESGTVAVPCEVRVRLELLEYLLTGPGGSTHETLLTTPVLPSTLNAALLTLGVEVGRNAAWIERDPPPTEEQRRQGIGPYEITYPEGDGFLLWLAWREGDEVYLFRIEDLLSNLATGRSMRRHRWVYLGSRFGAAEPGGEELFLADLYQNLINITLFTEGNTLMTAALPESRDQSIWAANAWLVPPMGSPVTLVFARDPGAGERLALDEAFRASLPEVFTPTDDSEFRDDFGGR